MAEMANALPGASINSLALPLPLMVGNLNTPTLPLTEEVSMPPVAQLPIKYMAAFPVLNRFSPAL
ncbi:hypothetical protein D3C71_1788320 [compost metagenome]